MITLIHGETSIIRSENLEEKVILPRERIEIEGGSANYYFFRPVPLLMLKYLPLDPKGAIPLDYYATGEYVDQILSNSGWNVGLFGLLYRKNLSRTDLLDTIAVAESYLNTYEKFKGRKMYDIVEFFNEVIKEKKELDYKYWLPDSFPKEYLKEWFESKGFIKVQKDPRRMRLESALKAEKEFLRAHGVEVIQ